MKVKVINNFKGKSKLFLGIILTILIILEIFLRSISPDILNFAYIIKNSKDYDLGYELLPNAKIKFSGFNCKIPITTIEISDQGLRDRHFDFFKPMGSKRIAFIGDSFVFGLGLNLNKAIPKVLESQLNKNSNINYEVMSCGVPGYNLIQEVEFLKTKVLSFNPDMIIFLITGNDIDREIIRPNNRLSNFLFKWSYVYRYAYVKLVNKIIREKWVKDPLLYKTIKKFKELPLLINDQQKIVIIIKNFSPWMQEILNISKSFNFFVLDLSKTFLVNRDNILISEEDGHFNEKGTKLVADQLISFLRDKLLIEN